MQLEIHGEEVPVTVPADYDLSKYKALIENFVPLQQWCKSMDKNLKVNSIEIQSIDLFGQRIGFLKFKANTLLKSANKIIPGIVFMRGDAVAVLVIVKTPTQEKLLLTEQYRVPIGKNLLEICAGMCDGDGNMTGVAIKELEEETGIKLNAKQLTDLGVFYPSAGGCDEQIHLYQCKVELGDQELEEMTRKIYGNHEEHEVIKLKFVDIEDAWQLQDAKLLVALGRYLNGAKK